MAKEKLDTIIDRCIRMIDNDTDRQEMFRNMAKMWHSEWSLPKELEPLEWVHKSVTTDPHDALRAGTRVLSTARPKLSIYPIGNSMDDRTRMNGVERALMWHYVRAGQRRQAQITRDIVLSALLYDEICAQVIFVPNQTKAMEKLRVNPARISAAKRFGSFSIVVHNPKDVLVEYSEWGPERVLGRKKQTLQEAVDFWGNTSPELVEKLKDQKEQLYVSMYDYYDLDQHKVWCYVSNTNNYEDLRGGGHIVLMDEENDLGWIPWATKVGGTTLEENNKHKRIPLLYSVYQAGQWETQNILETILVSEVIVHAAAARTKTTGPTDNIEYDYMNPGANVHVPVGHEFEPLPPVPLDPALATISDRLQDRISKSTVPKILQSAEIVPNSAFASLNLATQSGIKSLAPYKMLAEQVLADIFTQMLLWINYSQETITAYVPKTSPEGVKTETIEIHGDEIDIENIYLEVELSADVPTDQLSRINAASMAVQTLQMSRAAGLEQVGETDPELQMRLRAEEDLRIAGVEMQIEELRMKMEADMQAYSAQLQMQLQMAAQQQMAAMQQQQLQQQQQPPPQQAGAGGEQLPLQALLRNPQAQSMYSRQRGGMAFQNTQAEIAGQTTNPALGGIHPQMVNPTGTREEQLKMAEGPDREGG